MKVLSIIALCILVAAVAAMRDNYGQPGVPAAECSAEKCNIEDNCRCSSIVSPLPTSEGPAPILIGLTFDEAVTENLYNDYWKPLLFSKSNPDGKPIGATFFVPHESTDYEKVNTLYNYGFEIGVHSITKDPDQDYWRNATEELLEQEFNGQRQIISKFANIPIDDIIGVRTPQLQLAGNFSIRAFQDSELKYDSSWPAMSSNLLYPYTLDYLSVQDCSLGAECPNESFEGFWVIPINNIKGYEDKECNILTSCGVNGTATEIKTWLLQQLDLVAENSGVPITLIVETTWFQQSEHAYEALEQTLNELLGRGNVFIVTMKQILEWTQNPVNLENFETEEPDNYASCRPVTCGYVLGENDERYMRSCVTCPAQYPWLGNPNGDPSF